MDEEIHETVVCKPIDSLEEVMSWEGTHDHFSVAKIPRAALSNKSDVPKTLICHDMKGGYLQDRFIQGSNDSDAYRFYHWEYIDIFVYFSHHLVTIPPPCWTNAAHRHGIQILGTLITEWKPGFQCCHKFLENREVYERFADKLVKIAEYYRFDGWLVNIENVIEPCKVNDLKGFVECLTRKMHQSISSSSVIWYDSVVDTGHLDWQNELNNKNKMYFDVCDGIYLNYNWNDEKLSNSKQQALACNRPYDVYAGIDVFGRGTPGDGGYNTRQALAMVRNNDLSAAIFAQGWVYETHGKENFSWNENRFWENLYDLCPINKKTSLPLVTSFCQGYGLRYYLEGLVKQSLPWSNLSLQQIQPHLPLKLNTITSSPASCCSIITTQTAYQGGTSLLIEGEATVLPVSISLFQTEIPIKSSLCVNVVLKPNREGSTTEDVSLLLQLKHDDGSSKEIVLTSLDKSIESDRQEVEIKPNLIAEKNGWISRMYTVNDVENLTLCAIKLLISSSSSSKISFYLGLLKVVPIDYQIETMEIRDIRCTVITQINNNQQVYKIEWQCLQNDNIDYYNIYCSTSDTVLCGHSSVEQFVLVLDRNEQRKRIIIQPVHYNGEIVKLQACSFYDIF